MPSRHSTLQIVLHWTMAAVIAAAWLLGSLMEDLARGPDRATGLALHVLLGLGVLALLLPRLIARLAGPSLPPEPGETRWEHRLAAAAHLALYALMLLVPLAGLATALSARAPVPVLGLFELPNLWAGLGQRKLFEGAHEMLANLLLGVVVLHVLATLYHAVIRRDGVAGRMIPWLHQP
ncbi:cytochrome b [Falsiroseomonas sp.]|uniref:cytochrome b n=1 Tax=Falsiroseomonas sp. TaxID=2870721 RepID=UPI003F7108B9